MVAVAGHKPIVYPESDGQPMAENTLQWEWIVVIKNNLDLVFKDRDDVFVASDNFIYPVEGEPKIVTAPDVYVAIGRPKGRRGSYKVWEESGIFPQVVFEVLSPGNRGQEMARKFRFYEQYGVEEYYIYDPDTDDLGAWRRAGDVFVEVRDPNGYVSPLLGVRFDTSGPELKVFRPDGHPFLSFNDQAELAHAAEEERARADREQNRAQREKERADGESRRADTEMSRANEEQVRAEQAKVRADALAAKLRALGVDPNSP